MTINWLAGRKRKEKYPPPPSRPQQFYAAGNGATTTQLGLVAPTSPPRPPSRPQYLQPPAPANPGWPGNRVYQNAGAMVPSSQPYLPLPSPPGPMPPQRTGAHSPWKSSANLPLAPSPGPYLQQQHSGNAQKSKWSSYTNLGSTLSGPMASVTNLGGVVHKTTGYMCQGAALCDVISTKLDQVISSIDKEIFSGSERELIIYNAPAPVVPYQPGPAMPAYGPPAMPATSHQRREKAVVNATEANANYFQKVWLYANSRLPPHLPPFKVYIPTWPLLCLAAQYSERVYTKPTGGERETHVDADWRNGTKAMVLKSIPVDDMNTVVFAIRGSQTFMDWAVNFRPVPSSPQGFLDDPGNLCHAGFLSVARSMIKPVAARLRQLLEENPARSTSSLIITGHSAGGAVAALLYAHMLSETVSSELNHLTDCFKRVHCVTFGAPPVSLLPLQTPNSKRHRKSLFLSIINEGDPVVRADKAMIKSLLSLYASPAPSERCPITGLPIPSKIINLKPAKQLRTFKKPTQMQLPGPKAVWTIPPGTLSNAGRLVVLRNIPGRPLNESNVEACTVDDEMLRTVVFGDPVMHMMTRYKARVELLATRAVTHPG